MMIRLLLRNCFSVQKFRLEEYASQDYSTMCGLLKEKYQLNNEEVQTSGLIKLIDDAGKVIGIYTASEARKKSKALALDMVLVNKQANPYICRATDFRHRIVTRFYDDVVLKRQKELLSKVTSIKSLKISPSLNPNEMALKLKQLVELSQKNLKVRVFMMVKEAQREECLSKLEWIKAQLLNKCYIEEEISNKRFSEEEEQLDPNARTPQKYETYSFVVKARESNLLKKTMEEKELDPDSAIKHFLRKFYRQDDGEMMDLKSAGVWQVDTGVTDLDLKLQQKALESEEEEDKQREKQIDFDLVREAEARILNGRLKTLLSFHK